MAFIVYAVPSQADVTVADLDRLKVLAPTLQLEAQATEALRSKNDRALQRLAADIRKSDSRALGQFEKMSRERRFSTDAALKLGPCHYAGLTIRVLIVAVAEGRVKPRIKPALIDMQPPDLSDRYAAEVRRCELLERAEPSTRKIAASCLIDGKGCRESER